jgi:hypothetical protein
MRLLRGAARAALLTASSITPLLLLAARCIDSCSDGYLTPSHHPQTRRTAGALYSGTPQRTKRASLHKGRLNRMNRRRRRRGTPSGGSRGT